MSLANWSILRSPSGLFPPTGSSIEPDWSRTNTNNVGCFLLISWQYVPEGCLGWGETREQALSPGGAADVILSKATLNPLEACLVLDVRLRVDPLSATPSPARRELPSSAASRAPSSASNAWRCKASEVNSLTALAIDGISFKSSRYRCPVIRVCLLNVTRGA